jgi:tRNA pseudouridine38-40 synthase
MEHLAEPAPKRQRPEGETQQQQQEQQDSSRALTKRKVVILVAYNGARYQGLQKNPGAVTVAETLEIAMHEVGGISDDNFGTLQKISWSQAGRTDKGVHATGQVISLKLSLPTAGQQHEGMIERINERLAGSGIRILGCERASNNFCAHTMCSSREYEYLLPVYVLRRARSAAQPDAAAAPSAERAADPAGDAAIADDAEVDANAPLSATELERLGGILRSMQGTRRFHNFTDGKIACTDPQAKRFMIDFSVGPSQELDGVRYLPLRYHGQSFLLHQIRKMTALALAVFRGDVAADAVATAFDEPRIAPMPLAPACALTLRRALFESYERRKVGPGKPHNSVHFPECEAARDAFLVDEVLPHVAKRERAGEFREFASALAGYTLQRSAEELAERAAAREAARAAADARRADERGGE